MKFFRTITSAALLLMLGVTASAQATLSRLEEDITRGGGIYHSYEFDKIRVINPSISATTVVMAPAIISCHISSVLWRRIFIMPTLLTT